MFTIELASTYLEHAPQAERLDGTPIGWTLEDGNAICGKCAARIFARGCQVKGQPIWDGSVECKARLCSSFTLANDPPAPRRAPAVINEPERQRVLIDGLDCLPGQLDLF